MANWPEDLPQAPLLEGYESQRMDSKYISSVDAGLRKVRNRFRATPKNVTESYSLSQDQKNTLDDFYENILGGGAQRFNRVDPETGVSVSVRFTSVPSYSGSGADKHGPRYRVNFTTEVLPS